MLKQDGEYQLTKVYKDYLKLFASEEGDNGKNMRLKWEQLQETHKTWQLSSDVKPWSSRWKNVVGTR